MLVCINSLFRNYEHLCYQTNVAYHALVHHKTPAIYRIVRTLKIRTIQEREKKRIPMTNNRTGKVLTEREYTMTDRIEERKKNDNIYTIMATLTLMNCIQNDTGHNTPDLKLNIRRYELGPPPYLSLG